MSIGFSIPNINVNASYHLPYDLMLNTELCLLIVCYFIFICKDKLVVISVVQISYDYIIISLISRLAISYGYQLGVVSSYIGSCSLSIRISIYAIVIIIVRVELYEL